MFAQAKGKYSANVPMGEWRTGTEYRIPYKNPCSSFFKPTVMAPVRNGVGLVTEYDIEVLFAFEDGLLLPVIKHVQTGGHRGGRSVCVRDFLESYLFESDDFSESFFDFFEDCPNVKKENTEDGTFYYFTVSSAEGYLTKFGIWSQS